MHQQHSCCCLSIGCKTSRRSHVRARGLHAQPLQPLLTTTPHSLPHSLCCRLRAQEPVGTRSQTPCQCTCRWGARDMRCARLCYGAWCRTLPLSSKYHVKPGFLAPLSCPRSAEDGGCVAPAAHGPWGCSWPAPIKKVVVVVVQVLKVCELAGRSLSLPGVWRWHARQGSTHMRALGHSGTLSHPAETVGSGTSARHWNWNCTARAGRAWA